jgi:hypothetical protein
MELINAQVASSSIKDRGTSSNMFKIQPLISIYQIQPLISIYQTQPLISIYQMRQRDPFNLSVAYKNDENIRENTEVGNNSCILNTSDILDLDRRGAWLAIAVF